MFQRRVRGGRKKHLRRYPWADVKDGDAVGATADFFANITDLKKKRTMTTEKELIIVQLEQAFRRKSWHGPNLLGTLRGIDAEAAAWRPAPGRHNIWELIIHCAYWKYSVHRRFAGETKMSFDLKGSNWFERPAEATGKALKNDIALLRSHHVKLIESVTAFKGRFADIPKGSTTSFRDLAIGAAAHDLYHAGQIQLLKRLR